MAHQTLQSEGCILTSAPYGESHKLCLILTRDLGLIRAVARSARERRSKLRSSLQEQSLALFSFVRGREVWRITGALERENFYYSFKMEPEKVALLGRLTQLLLRLVQGEDRNEELFDVFHEGIRALKSASTFDELQNLECVTVGKILYTLGYMPMSSLLESPSFGLSERKELIGLINTSLKETHL